MINFLTDKDKIEANAMSIIESLSNEEYIIGIDVFPVACPISMLRGTFFVKKNSNKNIATNNSCAHGAGRSMSRADAINYWYNTLKNKERKWYYENYSEYLTNGEFSKVILHIKQLMNG